MWHGFVSEKTWSSARPHLNASLLATSITQDENKKNLNRLMFWKNGSNY